MVEITQVFCGILSLGCINPISTYHTRKVTKNVSYTKILARVSFKLTFPFEKLSKATPAPSKSANSQHHHENIVKFLMQKRLFFRGFKFDEQVNICLYYLKQLLKTYFYFMVSFFRNFKNK